MVGSYQEHVETWGPCFLCCIDNFLLYCSGRPGVSVNQLAALVCEWQVHLWACWQTFQCMICYWLQLKTMQIEGFLHRVISDDLHSVMSIYQERLVNNATFHHDWTYSVNADWLLQAIQLRTFARFCLLCRPDLKMWSFEVLQGTRNDNLAATLPYKIPPPPCVWKLSW